MPDSGDIVIVPAFSGLFAPHWRPDARGIIAGLTRYTTKAHIARAALEATAYQVADLGAAMAADLGADRLPGELRVDGGMTRNGLLMQIQADILGQPVVVPATTEISALGAAYAAGLAVGFWEDLDELRSMDAAPRRWTPRCPTLTAPPASPAGTRASSGPSAGSTRSGCRGPADRHAPRHAAEERRRDGRRSVCHADAMSALRIPTPLPSGAW